MGMGAVGGGKRRPMAEINMTPLVDVMLVLLVIFMVTAPMLDKSGVDVQLPKADGSKTGQGKTAIPWSLTIDTSGRVYVNGKEQTGDPSALKLAAHAEIGRASCRERVSKQV